jgi:hypothetical protein
MTLITGRCKVPLGVAGEAELHTAQVCCDGCPRKAAQAEASDRDRAWALAALYAEAEDYVRHEKGRKWLCPACRLRSLPPHLQALFPRLLRLYGPAKSPRRRTR